MSKQFIITQAELDMLEAIRLDIYKNYIKDDSVEDIIRAGCVTQPLWKIINKKREEVHE